MRCPADTSNASMYWKSNACLMTDRTLFPFMGYSLRTAEWRYVPYEPLARSAHVFDELKLRLAS